jgi:hypothetical protein
MTGWLAENAVAVAALALSIVALFSQYWDKWRSKEPVLHIHAERDTAKTDGIGLFNLVIRTFPRESSQIIEVRYVKVIGSSEIALGSHLWNYKPPVRALTLDTTPKVVPIVGRSDMKHFDIEIARTGAGTIDQPVKVRGVIIAPANIKTVRLVIGYGSPTFGGFKGQLRPIVELRELDIFG